MPAGGSGQHDEHLEPREPWRGRRVVLGVCGGIAAYKVAQVARDLTRLGAEVDVVLTRSAQRFVGATTFEGLTGRSVSTDMFRPGADIPHIRLAQEADLVCVAPASADLLSRAASGRSEDLLSAILLVTRAPVLLVPAMNDMMWSHPATQANVTRLLGFGYEVVEPAVGPLAQGEGTGAGRLPEADAIREHVGRCLTGDGPLHGTRVVVTAGPTREPVDAVRVLSNRSSGRMGFALAAAAWRRGAQVTLITGPTELSPPHGPSVLRVETAAEMTEAVAQALPAADVLIMAAAVADFRPADVATDKIKKRDRPDAIELEDAPDVLITTRSKRSKHLVSVGFALETDAGDEAARRKLTEKGLDLVVLNRADEADAGFEVDTNRVTLVTGAGAEELPLLTKHEVAERILDRVETLVNERARSARSEVRPAERSAQK